MSVETIENVEMEQEMSSSESRNFGSESEEFLYRPVSTMAVCSLMLGLVSLIGIFLWIMLPAALLTIVLGLMALVSIRRWQGEYTGTGVAIAGILFGAVTLVAGTAVQVNAFRKEVPDGYQRISFVKDISMKDFIVSYKGAKPHPDVEALVGKKVFFKGFVYPTSQVVGLTSFLLLKDSNECCFGGKPKLTDKVACIMQNGKTFDFWAGRVSVAGTFRTNPQYDGSDSDSVYILECDIVGPSKSDF